MIGMEPNTGLENSAAARRVRRVEAVTNDPAAARPDLPSVTGQQAWRRVEVLRDQPAAAARIQGNSPCKPLLHMQQGSSCCG